MTFHFCPKCSSQERIITLTKDSAIVRCSQCDKVFFVKLCDERWQDIFGVLPLKTQENAKG